MSKPRLILAFLAGALVYDLALRALWKWLYRERGEPVRDERLERVLAMRRLEYGAAGIDYDGEAVGVYTSSWADPVDGHYYVKMTAEQVVAYLTAPWAGA